MTDSAHVGFLDEAPNKRSSSRLCAVLLVCAACVLAFYKPEAELTLAALLTAANGFMFQRKKVLDADAPPETT